MKEHDLAAWNVSRAYFHCKCGKDFFSHRAWKIHVFRVSNPLGKEKPE